MKRTLIALAAAAAAISNTCAETLTFDFKDPKGVNNIVFKLDAPLESINGTTTGISGKVTVDAANAGNVAGKIVVAAETLQVPNPVMKEHLQGPKWLDIKTNPEISFEIQEVKNVQRDGNTGTADVKGLFILKGVSKEITVPVKVTYLPGKLKARGGDKEGDLLVVRSNFILNRSDFGIQPGQATDKVSEEIDISLSLAGSAPKE